MIFALARSATKREPKLRFVGDKQRKREDRRSRARTGQRDTVVPVALYK